MYFTPYRYYNISDENNNESTGSDQKQEERRKLYIPKYTILVCVSIIFLFTISVETIYIQMAATFFQYQPVLHVSASKASIMMSTMNVAFSAGRFVSVFIALYVTPQYMIIVQLFITLFGYIQSKTTVTDRKSVV